MTSGTSGSVSGKRSGNKNSKTRATSPKRHSRAGLDRLDQLLLTVAATADLLALSESQIYALIKRQELPSVKIGKARRIRKDDLAAYVARLGA